MPVESSYAPRSSPARCVQSAHAARALTAAAWLEVLASLWMQRKEDEPPHGMSFLMTIHATATPVWTRATRIRRHHIRIVITIPHVAPLLFAESDWSKPLLSRLFFPRSFLFFSLLLFSSFLSFFPPPTSRERAPVPQHRHRPSGRAFPVFASTCMLENELRSQQDVC